jgi:hypothetical protein
MEYILLSMKKTKKRNVFLLHYRKTYNGDVHTHYLVIGMQKTLFDFIDDELESELSK